MQSERQQLLAQLTSAVCACGRAKKRNQTFCARCFYSLPKEIGRALYERMGEGYGEAVYHAMVYLGLKHPEEGYPK